MPDDDSSKSLAKLHTGQAMTTFSMRTPNLRLSDEATRSTYFTSVGCANECPLLALNRLASHSLMPGY